MKCVAWASTAGRLAILGLALLCIPLEAAEAQRFDVPAGDAVQTLRIFSQQSAEQILYPVDQVRGVWTQRIQGHYTPRAALGAMLADSGLVVVTDVPTGALVITHGPPEEPAVGLTMAAGPSAPMAVRTATRAVAPDVVVLSPFEVRSRADRGYRATNSVSATRMATLISDLPMSITAFTEEFIADQKAYDLYDVVKWAPGVHQDNASPQGWVRYNIRGFTSAAVQRNGFSSFRFIDTTNIARVEVVKGPASLLYGQINPGGVINYITKRPEATPRVRLSAAVGDHNHERAVIDATGPVAGGEGRVFYRAIAMAENIQRFRAHERGRKYLLAPSLTWKISETATLDLEFEHFERHEDLLTSGVVQAFENGVATGPYPGLPWNFSYAGAGDFQDFASDAFTAEFTAKLGEHLNLKATYLDSYWDMEWRATGQGGTGLLAQSFIDYYYPPSVGLTSADAMYRRNRWEHHWGGERTAQVDAVSDFEWRGVRVRALAGLRRNFSNRLRTLQKNNPNTAGHPFYLPPWDLRNPGTWDRAVPFGLEALLLSVDSETSSDSTSLYGVVSAAAWRDRLRVLGGYARHRIHNNPGYNFIAGTATEARERAANVPQAGALVKVTPELSAFASYSQSFIANTSMLRVNNVPTTPALPAVGRGQELGLKLELFAGKLSGTVSAYRVQASPTGIVTVTSGVDANGTTVFTDVQGGRQLSEGFELDLLIKPVRSLEIVAGMSRSDAVYERHPSNPALNGTALVATPERTLSLWTKYSPESGPLANITLAGGLNYVGSIVLVGNNPFARGQPYTTFDVTVGYRFTAFARTWDVDLAMKNVTNERYYPSSSSWGFPRHAIFSIGTQF